MDKGRVPGLACEYTDGWMNTDRHVGRKLQCHYNSPVGLLSINKSINKRMHHVTRDIHDVTASLDSFRPARIQPVRRSVPYRSSRGRADRTETTLSRLDCPGFEFRHGKCFSSFPKHPQCLWGQFSLLLNWSLRIKWPEIASTTHSYILLKLEMNGAAILHPPYAFMT